MKAISLTFIFVLVCVSVALAQEELEAVEAKRVPAPVKEIKVHDMESLTIAELRKEFPRLSGVFASAHSCRLPQYGPMVSVTIQLPSYYFTRPVLQELDRRQRAAEEQAQKVRTQLERATQVISLRAKEANLMERIEWESSTKKKSKELVADLETELISVRKSLDEIESTGPSLLVVQESPLVVNDVDLNKMLTSNYQQLIERVSNAMKNSLAEHAPRIADLSEDERVTLNTFIRDSILGSQGKSMLFILHQKDIQDFKSGNINLDALKERVIVHDSTRE